MLWAGLVRKFDFKIRYVGEFNGVHAVELLARSLCFVSILSPIWLVFMVLLIRYIFSIPFRMKECDMLGGQNIL